MYLMFSLDWSQTLDLLCHITNAANVETVCDKLLSYLKSTTDAYFRTELVDRITELAERYPLIRQLPYLNKNMCRFYMFVHIRVNWVSKVRNEPTNQPTNERTNQPTNERASERTNERKTDRPTERTNERTNEQTKMLIVNSLKDMGSVRNSEGEKWNILHIKVSWT